MSGTDESVDAPREELRKLGYVEGRNIAYEYRWAAGRQERVQDLADELMRLKVDLGVTLIEQAVGTPEGIEAAFAAMKRQRTQALVVATSPFITSQLKLIGTLAAAQRLPVIYYTGIFADAGGLMYYGATQVEMHRKAATYGDRILKGAKHADLPVEEPTKYELIVNMKAAKALGLTIPKAVLLRGSDDRIGSAILGSPRGDLYQNRSELRRRLSPYYSHAGRLARDAAVECALQSSRPLFQDSP